MKIQRYIICLALSLVGLAAGAQNTLSVPDLVGGSGKEVSVPVNMTNTDEIVAVQFNLHLPFSLASGKSPVLNSSRNTAGHTIAVRSLGGNVYTIVIVNMSNKPLAGSDGTLLTFPMKVDSNLEGGAQYDMTVSDVVLTNRHGDNIQTGATGGTFTVQREDSPDLEVSDVHIVPAAGTDFVPGETVDVSWRVSNIGNADTRSGWTEKVYLVSTLTEESVYVGNAYFNNVLLKGGYTARNVAFTLPEAAGMEGEVVVKVVVEPNSCTGEYLADRGNNTATGDALTLASRLFLKAPAEKVAEGGTLRFTLTRSGDRSLEEVFTLTTDNGQQPTGSVVTLPATVTIPAGQASASFNVQVPQNALVNDYTTATVSVEPTGEYTQGVSASFIIEDDELLPLTLSLDKTEYNEGDTMHLTVSVPYRIGTADLTVAFSIEQAKRFELPKTYTFAPGATSAVIDIPVKQDNTPANVATIQLNASAEHHLSASTLLILNDDDVPAIDLALTPTVISEGAGGNAIFGTITRQEATNSKITVKLSDDSNGALYYTSTLTMPEGTTSITFPIGVKANQKVDGTRPVKITAAVYITDCGCSAIGNKQTSVVKEIEITDNDGPTLSITASKTTVLEGNAEGTVLTISRNDGTDTALPVTLACNASDVSMPASVTIPAGRESVTAVFKALSNATQEGNRTVSIKAVADGYASGSMWLLISDQTLPDAVLDKVEAPASVEAGQHLNVRVTLSNIGAVALPKNTDVKLTFGNQKTLVTLNEPLEAGATREMPFELEAPTVPGSYSLTAKVNPSGTITELQLLNNEAAQTISVTSSYDFTVQPDAARYKAGDTVHLSGTVLTKGGQAAAGIAVEPYVIYAGSRTPLTATSDAEGRYTADFVIPEGMAGTFTYGVCNPDEKLFTEKGTFKVYGFTRATYDYLTHKVFVGEPYAGTVSLKNLSDLPLHNIRATYDAYEGYSLVVNEIPLFEGNATVELPYAILASQTSKTPDWDRIKIHLSCDEGATLDLITYNYAQTHTPTLVVGTNSINTSVTKGKTRLVPLTLTNTGLGETGKISVLLPSGMGRFVTLATPAEMPSLATGDSATVMLRFDGTGYDVNLIQKGSIAINCEKGNGKAVYFNVKVVSEDKGNLLVRVADEATQYGDKDGNRPYVSGATVKLTDYNTGAVVATDVTGDDGSLLLENVAEGYYHLNVSAPKHDTYDQNILISPGETTDLTAYISYQAISVKWDVVETEIDDEYEIVTSLTYETQVPVPVVEITAPDTLLLDNIERGKSTLMNAVLRNRGLITAEDVKFTVPEAKGFVFRPLVPVSGFELAPEQSYVIPILVYHEEDDFFNDAEARRQVKRKADKPNCNGKFGGEYKWPCGPDSKFAWLEKPIQWATDIKCAKGGEKAKTGPGHNTPLGDPNSAGGLGLLHIGPGGDAVFAAMVEFLCRMCDCFCVDPVSDLKDGHKTLNGCGGSSGPGGAFNVAKYVVTGDRSSLQPFKDCAAGAAKFAAGKLPVHLDCLINPFIDEMSKAPRRKAQSKMPDLLESAGEKEVLYLYHWALFYDYLKEMTDAPVACDTLANIDEFVMALEDVERIVEPMWEDGSLHDFDLSSIPDAVQRTYTTADGMGPYLASLMPQGQTILYDFDLRRYVERLRNTWDLQAGREVTSDNHIDFRVIEKLAALQDSCVAKMVAYGYPNMEEVLKGAQKDWLEYHESASKNTCATVKLEIKQKLVLTRQAFRGTLTVDNGSATTLTDIDLSVEAINQATLAVATAHEMQINVESIEGFAGDKDGKWSLEPGQTGVATILFIPTKYAAPDTLTTYSFGGTLAFNDGTTVQSRNLYPVSLQVKPSPELDLTYFMQRDIYGDNPLTEDVIEPVVPAEFSVLIHNKGRGDATNVRMLTQQPEIVDNEKGLMADFAIVSSSLNGGEKAMALDSEIATQFGDIAAGTCSYATWDLTCSLLGHFTDYDVSYTHLTSYGNPDLSLLDKVTIHELIHSVNARVGDKTYRAWVTNDFADGHDEPDHIYLANGTDEDLVTLSNVTEVEPLGNYQYRISVTVPQKEWFYTNVSNPGGGYSKILYLKNEDTGEQLDPANFWTTDYTMQDGFDPLKDYRLHLADLSSGPGTRHYIVEFEPMPEVRLNVVSIEAVPDDEDIVEEPIDELTVTFNKDIDHTTFTRADIVLRYEGEIKDIELPITRLNGTSQRVFKIDTSNLTTNGYYALQVKTDSITDLEGFLGAEGRQVRWMLFKDGLVHYNIDVYPSTDYGHIQTSTNFTGGDLSYGSQISFHAVPTTGHRFVQYNSCTCYAGNSAWRVRRRDKAAEPDEEIVVLGTDPDITLEMNQVRYLRAVFEPIPYTVTVNCPAEQGTLATPSGIYDYGTVLTLDARPASADYELLGYNINGTFTPATAPYALTVEGNTVVEPVFKNLAPVSVLLNENTDWSSEPVERANVSFYRSFRKGTWNSVCLPCAVTDIDAAFGTGTQVVRLSGIVGTVAQFSPVTEMEANVPYLIKPGTLNSVYYTDGGLFTQLYDLGLTATEEPVSEEPTDTHGDISYIGTYTVHPIDKDAGNYYISSDLFYYVDAAASVNTGRYRGYFHVDNASASRLFLGIGTEGIVRPRQWANASGVFRLDGVLVRPAGASLDGLEPGLYVIDGQKVQVR